MKRVLVLCTGNSCRSQMAEAWLRHFANGRADIYSAGVTPVGVNSNAIAVMKESGIDISHHTSNHVDAYKDMAFDYVITVCDNAKEQCPYFPAAVKLFHHNFEDPSWTIGTEEEVLDAFRKTRDAIRDYCREFAETYLL